MQDIRSEIQRDETSNIQLNENKCKVLYQAAKWRDPAQGLHWGQ